jgi:hypothetical protein
MPCVGGLRRGPCSPPCVRSRLPEECSRTKSISTYSMTWARWLICMLALPVLSSTGIIVQPCVLPVRGVREEEVSDDTIIKDGIESL